MIHLFLLLLVAIHGFYLGNHWRVNMKQLRLSVVPQIMDSIDLENYLDMKDIVFNDEIDIDDHINLIGKEIFPSLDSIELARIARQYPMLITLDISNLKAAVKSIEAHCPGVDVNYLVRQKSAGIELFLCAAMESRSNDSKNHSPSLGHFVPVESAVTLSSIDQICTREKIAEVVGSSYNLTEFCSKVPHVFHPLYLRRLGEHMDAYASLAMGDLPDSQGAALPIRLRSKSKEREKFLSIVYSWPNILHIENLTESIDQFRLSLIGSGVCTVGHGRTDRNCRKFLLRVLEKEPSALIVDLTQRIRELKTAFPHWDMQKVIFEYPRILTIGWFNFLQKIEV